MFQLNGGQWLRVEGKCTYQKVKWQKKNNLNFSSEWGSSFLIKKNKASQSRGFLYFFVEFLKIHNF